MNALDLLLKANIQDMNLPTKEVKIKRLSDNLGADVVFKIKALKFDTIEEIRETNSKEFNVHTVLEGVVEPDLKSKELMDKFKSVTPVELLKTLLLAGEIEELYLNISRLSGYGMDTIEDVKKK